MNLKQWVRWVAALSMALPLAAAAEGVGIYGGFIGIGTDSAAPYQWHNAGLTRHSWIVDGNGDQVDFQDRVLGAFALGDSAFLSAGQLITHRGSDEQIEGAALHYCVRPIGNACSFAELDLPQAGEVSATSGFTDAAGYVWQFLNDPSNDAALGDRLWFGAPAVNFLNGLGAGDYALEVYFSATSSLGNTLWSFNPATGGATFVAVFSVTGTPSGVPEPPSLALAGLSLAMLAAVRRTWR